jgi:hypothetical protein
VPITPGNLPTLADYDEALLEIERVGGELRRAIEQVQALCKQLEDEKWECKQHKNAASEMRARERLRLAPEPPAEPVGYMHELSDPTGELLSPQRCFNGCPLNPFSYLNADHRAACVYTCTPLYRLPPTKEA